MPIFILLYHSVYLIGYIVYVALLLLRMANDAEENPGPTVYDIIYPSDTICAYLDKMLVNNVYLCHWLQICNNVYSIMYTYLQLGIHHF